MRISDWSSDVCSSDLQFGNGFNAASRCAHGDQLAIPFEMHVGRGICHTRLNALGPHLAAGRCNDELTKLIDDLVELGRRCLLRLGETVDFDQFQGLERSEERRVGKRWVSKGRTWGCSEYKKK